MSRVAVVTGSNKGIGYAIVKKLATDFGGLVYLTARDVARAGINKTGQSSLEKLKQEVGAENGKKVMFHQLDVCDRDSVVRFLDHLKKEHGGLDVLVNNAGVFGAMSANTGEALAKDAEFVLGINYFGTRQACEILFPILKPHARVVNIATRLGSISSYGEELKKQLKSADLTVEQLDAIMNKYLELTKTGKHTDHGYPGGMDYYGAYINPHYMISKAGVLALTFLWSRLFKQDSRPDLVANAACPGYVATDLTGHDAKASSPEQGADTPAYLAMLPENVPEPRGQFVAERNIISWEA